MGFFTPVIREYLQGVSYYAKGKLLDVGCGDKPYRRVFQHIEDYIGFDRPAGMDVERYNQKKRKNAIDVHAEADSFPFLDASFDTVLAMQVIEHLPHPKKFFEEVSRVLVQGGYLILTFPLINPLHEEPYDFFRYTEYGINILSNMNGLQVVKTTKMGGGWLTIGYLLQRFCYISSESAKSKRCKNLLLRIGSIFYDLLSRVDKKYCYTEAPLNYLMILIKR